MKMALKILNKNACIIESTLRNGLLFIRLVKNALNKQTKLKKEELQPFLSGFHRYFHFKVFQKHHFSNFSGCLGLYYGSSLNCGTSVSHLIFLDPSFPICKMGSWAPTVEGASGVTLLCCCALEAASVSRFPATQESECWPLLVCDTSRSIHPKGRNVSKVLCFTVKIHVNF